MTRTGSSRAARPSCAAGYEAARRRPSGPSPSTSIAVVVRSASRGLPAGAAVSSASQAPAAFCAQASGARRDRSRWSPPPDTTSSLAPSRTRPSTVVATTSSTARWSRSGSPGRSWQGSRRAAAAAAEARRWRDDRWRPGRRGRAGGRGDGPCPVDGALPQAGERDARTRLAARPARARRTARRSRRAVPSGGQHGAVTGGDGHDRGSAPVPAEPAEAGQSRCPPRRPSRSPWPEPFDERRPCGRCALSRQMPELLRDERVRAVGFLTRTAANPTGVLSKRTTKPSTIVPRRTLDLRAAPEPAAMPALGASPWRPWPRPVLCGGRGAGRGVEDEIAGGGQVVRDAHGSPIAEGGRSRSVARRAARAFPRGAAGRAR